MKAAVLIRDGGGGLQSVLSTVNGCSYFAIGFGVLVVLVMLAAAFVPFSSRAERKYSPTIFLVVAAILVAALAGLFIWNGANSIMDRDRLTKESDRTPTSSYEQPASGDGNTNTIDVPANADDEPPPPPPPPGSKTVSGGILNGKAVTLPEPAFPQAARAVHASGRVNVQVLVDEKGDVVEASAVSGHALLRAAATQAARSAHFPPTLLGGKPVKVSGILTYDFTP
jgi:TonB family protein